MELFALFVRHSGKLTRLTPNALPLKDARARWKVKLSQGAVLQVVEGEHYEEYQGNHTDTLKGAIIQTAFRDFKEKVTCPHLTHKPGNCPTRLR